MTSVVISGAIYALIAMVTALITFSFSFGNLKSKEQTNSEWQGKINDSLDSRLDRIESRLDSIYSNMNSNLVQEEK